MSININVSICTNCLLWYNTYIVLKSDTKNVSNCCLILFVRPDVQLTICSVAVNLKVNCNITFVYVINC